MIDDFLSDAENDHMIAEAEAKIAPSIVVGGQDATQWRTSSSTFFTSNQVRR
jgi:hypothetical protein